MNWDWFRKFCASASDALAYGTTTRVRTPASTGVVASQAPCDTRHPTTEPEGPAICHRPIGINGELFMVELSASQHEALCDLTLLQMSLAIACHRDRKPYVHAWEA
jgi:hypothetical protein